MTVERMIVMMTSWRAYWLLICIAGGLGNGGGYFVGGGRAWESAGG